MQKTIRLLDGNHTDCGGFLLDLAYPHRPTLRFILHHGPVVTRRNPNHV